MCVERDRQFFFLNGDLCVEKKEGGNLKRKKKKEIET